MQRYNRFHHQQKILLLNKLFNHDGLMRLMTQTAPSQDLETKTSAIMNCDDAHIVHHRLGAVGLTRREADLELAWHLLVQRVA